MQCFYYFLSKVTFRLFSHCPEAESRATGSGVDLFNTELCEFRFIGVFMKLKTSEIQIKIVLSKGIHRQDISWEIKETGSEVL